MHPSFC